MPAVSVAQQRFMGMVHAAKKGTLKNPSPSVARAAASMSDQDAKDFASTKHEGLPKHVEKEAMVALDPNESPVHQQLADLYQQEDDEYNGLMGDQTDLSTWPSGAELLQRVNEISDRYRKMRMPLQQQLLTPQNFAEKMALSLDSISNSLPSPQTALDSASAFGKSVGNAARTAGEAALPAAGYLGLTTALGGLTGLGLHGFNRLLGPNGVPEDEWRRHRNQNMMVGAAGGVGIGLSGLLREAMRNMRANQAVKVGYVKLNPTERVASKPRVRNNFQTPPAIGQPKPGPLTPPATQDAQKMVMRSAPSVPNPIVPPAQSGEPLKLASCIMPAPRYTAGAKKGKKPMPQPHARQLKTKQASHITFAQQMASGIEKKALGGLGTTIGAVGGLATAPTGHRMEGVGRGVGQGLGWDIGAGLGGGLGAVGGGMALPALLQLIASARGQQADPQSLANATGAGIVGGGLTGIVGGGMLGRSAAKGMMGNPTWQDEDTQRKATAANMAAP